MFRSQGVKLCPQHRKVLHHLEKEDHITQLEALFLYKVSSLTTIISDLRAVGHPISREFKKDSTGRRYARYALQRR